MKRYCLDTSGFSNPLEFMPQDIHHSMWRLMADMVRSGVFACTTEVYEEPVRLPGNIGTCICDCETELVLDVDNQGWNLVEYITHVSRMQLEYQQYIAEYNENRRATVGLNDISIVALAKTLDLPLVSMESAVNNSDSSKRRIPDICLAEGVRHLTFNDMLRAEGHRI